MDHMNLTIYNTTHQPVNTTFVVSQGNFNNEIYHVGQNVLKPLLDSAWDLLQYSWKKLFSFPGAEGHDLKYDHHNLEKLRAIKSKTKDDLRHHGYIDLEIMQKKADKEKEEIEQYTKAIEQIHHPELKKFVSIFREYVKFHEKNLEVFNRVIAIMEEDNLTKEEPDIRSSCPGSGELITYSYEIERELDDTFVMVWFREKEEKPLLASIQGAFSRAIASSDENYQSHSPDETAAFFWDKNLRKVDSINWSFSPEGSEERWPIYATLFLRKEDHFYQRPLILVQIDPGSNSGDRLNYHKQAKEAYFYILYMKLTNRGAFNGADIFVTGDRSSITEEELKIYQEKGYSLRLEGEGRVLYKFFGSKVDPLSVSCVEELPGFIDCLSTIPDSFIK